jgi:hypothetical protein
MFRATKFNFYHPFLLKDAENIQLSPELEEALKKLAADKPGAETVNFDKLTENLTPERRAELEEFLEWWETNQPKPDVEYIKEAVVVLNTPEAPSEQLIEQLELLEDIVSQYDNAVDFAKVCGF